MSGISQQHIDLLKVFIASVKMNPSLLHDPSIRFFKEYLESLGATIPPKGCKSEECKKEECKKEECKKKEDVTMEEPEEKEEPEPEPEPEPVEEEEEEEPEPDDDQLIAREPFEPTDKLNITHAPSEEEMDKANSLKSEAMRLQSDGDLDGAIAKLNEAIKLNQGSGILFATRANILLRQKRPSAAIHDCTMAIQANPDSAKAYKVRGKAYRLVGDYEKAKTDLDLGNKLDFDEETYLLQKFVDERVAFRENIARKRREREEAKRPKAKPKTEAPKHEEHDEGMGGMPGMGGVPPDFINKLMSDPALMSLLQDPEVMGALSNPAKLGELLSNPKYAKLAELIGSFKK